MAKKLKALAEDSSDSELAAQIRDSANNIWLAGLGAFVKAQAEGGKVFNALVKEGETVQKRAKDAASSKISEINVRAGTTWDKLEQVFEDRVARALHGLNVPTKKDVDKLSMRVAALTTVVEKLSAEIAEEAPKKKTRKKRTTSRSAKQA
ncbi:MAG: phasin family protein [Alphaproteobacteria bacterium]|nr:phasin family protein [Alphaproteobacteria bacterium]